MFAYKPQNWIEALYVGALVFAPWRIEADLMPTGYIFGFVWDTDDNGIVIEFEEEQFFCRFFVPWNRLEAMWHTNGMFYAEQDALFVGLRARCKYRENASVRVGAYIKKDRKKIPVYTQYC